MPKQGQLVRVLVDRTEHPAFFQKLLHGGDVVEPHDINTAQLARVLQGRYGARAILSLAQRIAFKSGCSLTSAAATG